MPSPSWARSVIGSLLLAVCAAACANVLDIEEPKARNDGDRDGAGAAGEAAKPDNTATATGGVGGADNTPLSAGSGAGQGGSSDVLGGAGAGAGESGRAGESGAGGMAMGECTPDNARCGGAAEKTPEICDQTGHWVANSGEADGDCAVCLGGQCVECSNGDLRCTPCPADAADCDTNRPQTCLAGVWTNAATSCSQYCDAGVCETTPSCDSANTFRTTCKAGESCCKSRLVPRGSFQRDPEGSDDNSADSVQADIDPFFLDKFEVTVGRARQFVSAYAQVKLSLPKGKGKSPNIDNDAGWDSDAYVLPDDDDALLTDLKSCPSVTWSDNVDENNDLPLNCVSFNVAYAFCVWDGGRLPTEAEWHFAAAGGREQRAYPWMPPVVGPAITDEYANYGDANPGPISVGSKPLGNARWGQADMAGNVMEWVLDYYGDYPTVCDNCMNSTAAEFRAQRGGAYSMSEDALPVSVRGALKPSSSRAFVGFRCARDLSDLERPRHDDAATASVE